MTAPGTGILDTSALLDLGRLDPAHLPSEPLITAITLAELTVGALVAHDDRERAARQAHLQQAEADFDELRRVTRGGRRPGFGVGRVMWHGVPTMTAVTIIIGWRVGTA